MPRVESSAANDSHVLSALETHQSTVTNLVHESGTQQQIVEQLQSRLRQVLHHMTSCTYNIQEVERCHKLHVKCIFLPLHNLLKTSMCLCMCVMTYRKDPRHLRRRRRPPPYHRTGCQHGTGHRHLWGCRHPRSPPHDGGLRKPHDRADVTDDGADGGFRSKAEGN